MDATAHAIGNGSAAAAVQSGFNIRRATAADLPALLGLARISRFANYDPDWGAVHAWAREIIDDPAILVVRGERSAAVAMASAWFWKPDRLSVTLLFLFGGKGAVWEMAACCRAVGYWARALGVDKVKVDDVTEDDLTPIMQRLGPDFAVDAYPAFTINIVRTRA